MTTAIGICAASGIDTMPSSLGEKKCGRDGRRPRERRRGSAVQTGSVALRSTHADVHEGPASTVRLDGCLILSAHPPRYPGGQAARCWSTDLRRAVLVFNIRRPDPAGALHSPVRHRRHIELNHAEQNRPLDEFGPGAGIQRQRYRASLIDPHGLPSRTPCPLVQG